MKISISPILRRSVAGTVVAAIFLCSLELLARVFRFGNPALATRALPEEHAGVLQFDPVLFWSLRPGFNGTFERSPVTVNQFGIRGTEIPDKGDEEIRILSLGESSTFGVSVGDEETYSARLSKLLNGRAASGKVRVINAGVSAYSSFQSVLYLKRRGLNLRPDVVLFYHEVNDYLPSTLRDSSQNELGVMRTDKELYESRARRAASFMMAHSALFRCLVLRDAERRIRNFRTEDVKDPLGKIGLSGIGLSGRVEQSESMGINEIALGRRVSDEERIENLRELTDVCQREAIRLIVIHPSYRHSRAHECLLSRFCEENNALMFDAHDSLHPEGFPHGALFTDSWHPNAEGHRRLAENLAKFILERGILEVGTRKPELGTRNSKAGRQGNWE